MTRRNRFLQSCLGLLGLCVFWLNLALVAQEPGPELGKLVGNPVCLPAVQFARTNDIRLDGIEPLTDSEQLRPGDSITAVLTLFEKGGHESQWLLELKAAEPTPQEKASATRPALVCYAGVGEKIEFSQSVVPVQLRIVGPFSERTRRARAAKIEDQRARITVNQGFLRLGLEPAAAATYGIVQNHRHGSFVVRSRPFTTNEIAQARRSMAGLQLNKEEQRAIAGANLALDSYARIIEQTPGLNDILSRVVKPPSLWSVMWHLGVKVNLKIETKYVAPAQTELWHLGSAMPCYRYPLTVEVNDRPALLATLLVAPSRPPLLASAGIVGLLAENPAEKETYLLLRVISAHHHPAGAELSRARGH